MITEIGIVAGEILTFLDESREEIDIEDIKYCLNRHPDSVLMALGWMIREGHVIAERKEGKMSITQRETCRDERQEESMELCEAWA